MRAFKILVLFLLCLPAAYLSLEVGEPFLYTPRPIEVREPGEAMLQVIFPQELERSTRSPRFAERAVRRITRLPQSKLSLRLVGLYEVGEDTGSALIENSDTSQQDLFRIADSLFSKATLMSLHDNYVVISNNGHLERLELLGGVTGIGVNQEEEQAARETAEKKLFQEALISNLDEDSELPESIYVLTENDLNIFKFVFLVAKGSILSGEVLRLATRDGETVGMEVGLEHESDTLAMIGLAPGDIITSINGQEMNGLDDALNIVPMAQYEGWFDVTFERDQETHSLSVAFVPPALKRRSLSN